MSKHSLTTTPETAEIRRRLKTAEEEESVETATDISTSSVAVVESPKRRKVESAAESANNNRSSTISSSPRKPPSLGEKNDSSAVDTRLWRFCSGSGIHAPSSSACSEEESSSGFFKQIADPSDDDWLKIDTSSHVDGSVVVSSPESEVCVDLPEKEMESKSKANPQTLPVVFQTPTAAEIEEFFLAAEKIEAQRFKDKYNFDIVNDVPLKGRFEWSRVKH